MSRASRRALFRRLRDLPLIHGYKPLRRRKKQDLNKICAYFAEDNPAAANHMLGILYKGRMTGPGLLAVTKPSIAATIKTRDVYQGETHMQVTIELPEDVSQALQERWGDVSRRTLEAIAIEGYRSGALTESQVRRLLGFETRMDVHAFLQQAEVPLHYTMADVEADLEAHRKLGLLPNG